MRFYTDKITAIAEYAISIEQKCLWMLPGNSFHASTLLTQC